MLLLIPGPVTTRPEVREALRHDFAPWDNDFRPLYAGIRERVLRIARGVPGEHATLPLQGCGHFITEAAIRTFVPLGSKLLIPAHRLLRRPHDPAGARGRPRPGAAAGVAGRGRPIRMPSPPRSRPTPTSAMSAWSTARPAAASCTTWRRSAPWCAGSAGG